MNQHYHPLTSNAFALITGASTGLGAAFAARLAKAGKPLLLVALPGEQLQEKAAALKQTFGVEVIALEIDLTHENGLQALFQQCTDAGWPIDMLLNNAGVGGSQPFETASSVWLEKIISLNVLATTLLTQHFLPVLKAQPRALILNVSSMAAFTPMPYKMVYPASKAFVTSFSMGLDAELRASTNVRVFCLHPGGMKTNEDVSARLSRQSWLGKQTVLPVDRIVDISLNAIWSDKTVIVPGWANRMNYWLFKFLPWSVRSRALVKFMKRELNL